MSKASGLVQIIIAWTEEDFVVARERRRDLGELPEMKSVRIAKTCVRSFGRSTPGLSRS